MFSYATSNQYVNVLMVTNEVKIPLILQQIVVKLHVLCMRPIVLLTYQFYITHKALHDEYSND